MHGSDPDPWPPDLDRRVVRATDEQIVCVEQERPDALEMAGQSLDTLAASNVPQLDRLVNASGR